MSSKLCRNGAACTRPDCYFVHPPGRRNNNNSNYQFQQSQQQRNNQPQSRNANPNAKFFGNNNNNQAGNAFFQQSQQQQQQQQRNTSTTASIFGGAAAGGGNNYFNNNQGFQNNNNNNNFNNNNNNNRPRNNNNQNNFNNNNNRNNNNNNVAGNAFAQASRGAGVGNLFQSQQQQQPQSVFTNSSFLSPNNVQQQQQQQTIDDDVAEIDTDNRLYSSGATLATLQSDLLANTYPFSCYGTSMQTNELPGDLSPEEWRLLFFQAAAKGEEARVMEKLVQLVELRAAERATFAQSFKPNDDFVKAYGAAATASSSSRVFTSTLSSTQTTQTGAKAPTVAELSVKVEDVNPIVAFQSNDFRYGAIPEFPPPANLA